MTTAQNTIGAGTDTLSGFENLTGSAFNDTLTGNCRRQHPHRPGRQRHAERRRWAPTACWAALGHDTYVVDNVGDVVDETGGDGTDTVQTIGQLQPCR